MRRTIPLALVLLALAGCADDDALPDAGPATDAGPTAGGDAAPSADAASITDGGSDPVDAGRPDATPTPLPMTWSPRAALAGGPRQETAVVAYQGEVVVIGGYDENAQFGPAVEAYDPTADSWRSLADLPVPMHHANGVVVDGRMMVVGFLGGGFQEDGRIFEYLPARLSWEARGEMPAARARGSSVIAAHDGQIYIVGGLRNAIPVSMVDRFDPSTGDWQPLPPISRNTDHAAGGVIDGKLYVAGGRSGAISSHVPRLDVLDLSSFEWSAGPPMPTSRGGTAGAVLAGRLFVIGGEGNGANPATGLFEAVEAFDPALGQWSTLPPIVPARHGLGAAAIGDLIYVPGGADVEAFGAVSTHQVLGP